MRIVLEWFGRYVRLAGQGQVVLWVALAVLAGLGALLAAAQKSAVATGEQAAAPVPVTEEAPVTPEPVVPARDHEVTEAQNAILESNGWNAHVGDRMGVWVSVGEQRLRLLQGGRILWEAPCSTAAKGIGARINSYQTPLGWHSVAEKIGEGKPAGQVYREKRAANEVWKPGDVVKEDLVLTRVLTLRGEEPGRNQGGEVDSYARGIYIHGTNDEARIGTPTSHGCVRLSNADVITAFERIPQGTLVLITE